METPAPMIYNLQMAREPVVPSSLFKEMIDIAENLHISDTDVYGDFGQTPEKSSLRRFEQLVAARCGKEEGLFVLSGCMAQSILLKKAVEGKINPTFACHFSSHLLLHEKDGFDRLLNIKPVVVKSTLLETQAPMLYQDVAPLLDAESPPCMLIIETPHRELGGKCTPWEDLERMSAECRRKGIVFHCDGARLWEAESFYCDPQSPNPKTFEEFCGLFDSIYVSFYKGLGAVTGAMILATTETIVDCRVWSRRFGGNVYCQLPYFLSCWNGFNTNGPQLFLERKAKLSRVVALITNIASELEAASSSGGGGGILRFDPPVPHVPMIHVHLRGSAEKVIAARDHTTSVTGVACFRALRPFRAVPSEDPHPSHQYFEMNMGPKNAAIEDALWARGWTVFLQKLLEP